VQFSFFDVFLIIPTQLFASMTIITEDGGY
jgi:hypothetical protein